jgi:glycosyltransferase involved in cell wall biosynthesis
VLTQTCQDFEIVVVDDGSADNPGAVVAALDDPRIRVIAQANAGGGAARNTGIDHAKGDFCAFLDSDDVFLPDHLQAMKVLAQTANTAAYARVRVDRGGGKVFLKPPRGIRPGEDMGEYMFCGRGFVPTNTLVVPRGLAAKVRYHTHLRAAEDNVFAIRLALAGCRFVMLAAPGAVWMDSFDPNRSSAARGESEFAAWLDEMKPCMTSRAWHGARGWALAKLAARARGRLAALPLTLNAILRGCYGPKLACVVLLQVLLGTRQYRLLADTAIAWLNAGLREKNGREPTRRRARA